jgi:hypothetical protein
MENASDSSMEVIGLERTAANQKTACDKIFIFCLLSFALYVIIIFGS